MDETLERFKNMTPEEANAYLEEYNACSHDCSTCTSDCASKTKKPAKLIISVMSGKGGTGKSTVCVLLANALRRVGLRPAILDADVSGSGIPFLVGMHDPVIGDSDVMAPAPSPMGVPIVSNALVAEDPKEPIIWPGLDMAKVAVYYFQETDWGKGLDVLLVDMPTGTGDIPLEYYTTMPFDCSLFVITPGEFAAESGLRAVNLAEMLRVPVMGVVENFACDELKLSDKFSEIPVAASLNYDPALRVACDKGQLESFETPAFDFLARTIKDMISD
jgi:Mrp family chromosome partitioning ATPase